MRPNRELVVYCLYLTGGTTERVHTEDLALKCWELFPDSFSWTNYPKYPDKDIVRVALTDARKEQYGENVVRRIKLEKISNALGACPDYRRSRNAQA